MSKDEYFEKMLQFILKLEGGYSNNPADLGGETNKGITYKVYNNYRLSKKLSLQSVKNITNNEIRDIYYNDYYRASGADKLDNPRLGFYTFDTAVNMGVSVAKSLLKQSCGNLDIFEKLRRDRYQLYASANQEQKQFLEGWNNRVDQVKIFADKFLPEIKKIS